MNAQPILHKISSPFFGEVAKAIEIVFELYNAQEETDDILKIVHHVNVNLENVRRLRRTNAGQLGTHDLIWIDTIIRDTEAARASLATLVERARVEKATSSHMVWSRVLWVSKHAPKVKDKVLKLTMCHQSLMSVFPFLFNDRAKLSRVVEETHEKDYRLSDRNMENWLNWQAKPHRKRGSTRSSTGVTGLDTLSYSSTKSPASSLLSSSSSALTTYTDSECPPSEEQPSPTAFAPIISSSCVITSSTSISDENFQSGTLRTHRESPHNHDSNSLQFQTDLLPHIPSPLLHLPSLDFKAEGFYNPPSTVPENTPSTFKYTTTSSNIYEGSDGLQVYEPLDRKETNIKWNWQPPTSEAFNHPPITSRQSCGEGTKGSTSRHADFISSRQALGQVRTRSESHVSRSHIRDDTITSGSILPPIIPLTQDHCGHYHATESDTQSLPKDQSLEKWQCDNQTSPREGKLSRSRNRSNVPTHENLEHTRPSIAPKEAAASPRGGRSLSDRPRSARRASFGWLAFHASREDISDDHGWGEG